MNVRIGGIALTDIDTWRADLWNAGWTVRVLMIGKRRLLLYRRMWIARLFGL